MHCPILDDKDKEGDGEKKEKKDENKEGGARNLWVSGLSGDTRAKDLKQLCSKHGKVNKPNIFRYIRLMKCNPRNMHYKTYCYRLLELRW